MSLVIELDDMKFIKATNDLSVKKTSFAIRMTVHFSITSYFQNHI